ncbi:MarR family winged helix-turn-helix transcriptional regulator [Microcella humidisoli]|jgi:DNA-binding MarR family transcriptional regulator|uniref:MarR family transcriptional regulator n=1 Tax=Microcella humidisoli TaxID=2963406 RepID=A0ABY5FXS1_9MICO|nr:MarR family transcriptional regulator [Microcella humidisoli]UTT62868.1 MarR family transcriptional regulator [Microcella humidisoli]
MTDRVSRIQAEWQRERPDLDVAPQGVFGRLARLAAAIEVELEAVFRQHGLTTGEFDVLAALRRAGAPYERTPTALADSTMVTAGGLTKRVDRLEDRGLVTRRISPLDGRGRVVALTDAGLTLVERAFEAHLANEHRLLAPLDTADRAALERLLRIWLDWLRAEH